MTLDDRRRKQLLLAAAVVLAGVGLWAFVLRGADGPADPSLGARVTDAASPSGTLPGDPARVPLEAFEELAVSVEGTDGSFLAWCLLAALTSEQRSRGLMEVTDLQGYSGMAFVYEEDVQNAFYMRNTPLPLSIAWIGADGAVVGTVDMEPCDDRGDCPTYPPPGPYRYAIEVPQGELDDLGIVAGAAVRVGGACTPASGQPPGPGPVTPSP